jgi:hypothetical protein
VLVLNAIALASCGWPGSGFYRGFVTVTALPAHWVKTSPGWQANNAMSYVPGASAELGQGHVQDWNRLVSAVVGAEHKSSASPERRIWDSLSEEGRRVFGAAHRDPRSAPNLTADLTRALNKALRDPAFYEPAAFKGVRLPARTAALAVRKKLPSHEVIRRNRLLLVTATIRSAGFVFSDADTPRLAVFARDRLDLEQISALLLQPETRARGAREARIAVGDVSLQTMAANVTSGSEARWLAGILKDAGARPGLNARRVDELFEARRRRARVSAAVAEFGEGAQEEGMTLRDGLLLFLSLLVCAVGVANAMLMSVTERFTEIATMKCLGGLDGFIIGLFVFEAMIQGVFGGLVGGLLGLLLAGVRGLFEFGSLLASVTGSPGPIFLAVLGSGLVGILLAAVAAVGPAWVAARLSPMEAMRVD